MSTTDQQVSECETESGSEASQELPERCPGKKTRGGGGGGGGGAWQLHQKRGVEFAASTDGSDLEDFDPAEDGGSGRLLMPRKVSLNLDLSTAVSVKSLNPASPIGPAKKAKKKEAAIPKIEIENKTFSDCLKQAVDKPGDSPDDDGGSSEDTDDEQLEVNLADFKFILKEEVLDRSKNDLELRSYEARVSSKAKLATATGTGTGQRAAGEEEEEDGETTSEGEMMDDLTILKSKKRSSKSKKGKNKKAKKAGGIISCNGGNSTDASDVEVSTRDYYKIRHENDVDKSERRLSLTEALRFIKFDPNSKFDPSAAKSEPSTSEDSCDTDSSQERDTEEESDDADKTCTSEVVVPEKDYYIIRKETSPRTGGMCEYILEMNPVGSSVFNMEREVEDDEDASEYIDDTGSEEVCLTREQEAEPLQRRRLSIPRLKKKKKEDSETEESDSNAEEAETDDEEVVLSNRVENAPLGARMKEAQKPRSSAVYNQLRSMISVAAEESDQEDIPCEDGDLMSWMDYLHAHRNDFDLTSEGEPSYIKMKAGRFIEEQARKTSWAKSETDVLSGSSDNEDEEDEDEPVTEYDKVPFGKDIVSLDKFYESVSAKRPQYMPIIRMVEVDGCEGAIGVLCDDPRSPTQDRVFGIKFLNVKTAKKVRESTTAIKSPYLDVNKDDIDSNTEEFSDMSDEGLYEEAEPRGKSPDTEAEVVVSDGDCGDPAGASSSSSRPTVRKHHQEYYLPSPRKKLVLLKEHQCGSTQRIEEFLDPNEKVGLQDFLRENPDEVNTEEDEILDAEGNSRRGSNVGGGQKEAGGGLRAPAAAAKKPEGKKRRRNRNNRGKAAGGGGSGAEKNN